MLRVILGVLLVLFVFGLGIAYAASKYDPLIEMFLEMLNSDDESLRVATRTIAVKYGFLDENDI